MSFISTNMKILRKSNNWVQEYVANEIGTSKHVISNWERGVANPDLNQLLKLANLFNVSTDSLLGNDNFSKSIKDTFTKSDASIDLIALLNSGTTITFKKNTLTAEDIEAITGITNILFNRIYPNK